MPRTYTVGLRSLLEARTLRRSSLWKIEREDGADFHFTDHDVEIEYGGDTYAPAGGFDASARQRQTGLKTQNLEIVGMLSSGAITEDDLRDGRYRNAKATETLVDWRYPWVGALAVNVYWIVEVAFTGETWTAKLEGIQRHLLPRVGEVFSRNCRYDLGDARCTVSLGPLTAAGTVSGVTSQRNTFNASGITATANYYDYGKLTWTSGDNDGLSFDVKLHSGASVELQLDCPNDVQVGDTFNIIAGCDKLIDTCKTKFTNFVNYGGFPFIPGTERMMLTPKDKPFDVTSLPGVT